MLKIFWRCLAVGALGIAFTISAAAEPTPVSFITNDNIEIAATLDGVTKGERKQPVIIFIHQGGSSKEEWTGMELWQKTVASGMIALAYDVRGHGQSGGKADYSTLFDDPNQAPLDLEAALAFIKSLPTTDEKRIAIVGASIGSNLAVMATALPDYGVKTAVAISGKASAVYNLAGSSVGNLPMRSIFHIASEYEQDGLRASWAGELYDSTIEPRRLEIIEGSHSHGVSIFQNDPGLADRIMDWLTATLQ